MLGSHALSKYSGGGGSGGGGSGGGGSGGGTVRNVVCPHARNKSSANPGGEFKPTLLNACSQSQLSFSSFLGQ